MITRRKKEYVPGQKSDLRGGVPVCVLEGLSQNYFPFFHKE